MLLIDMLFTKKFRIYIYRKIEFAFVSILLNFLDYYDILYLFFSPHHFHNIELLYRYISKFGCNESNGEFIFDFHYLCFGDQI